MQAQLLSLPSSNLHLRINMKFILILALSFFLQGALGELICEELPVEMCTLSIASNGKRCVLESRPSSEGKLEVECQTSEVFASNKMLQEYIETDECVGACGVDRQSLGLSSDALLDSKFMAKLCSHQCYTNCPNIIDLYSNVASAEGVPLPKMCSSQKIRPRRGMSQLILSSGAAGPVVYGGGGSVSDADAPVGSRGPGSDYAPPPEVIGGSTGPGSDNADAPVVSGGPGYAAPSPGVDRGSTGQGSDAAPPVVYGGPVSDAPTPEGNYGGSTGSGSDAAPPFVYVGPGSDAPPPEVNSGSTGPGSDAAPPVFYGGPVSNAPTPDVNGGSGSVSDEAPPPSQY